jgi:hypothetical protein
MRATRRRSAAAALACSVICAGALTGNALAAPGPGMTKGQMQAKMRSWNSSFTRLAPSVKTCRPASYRLAVGLRAQATRNLGRVRTRAQWNARAAKMTRAVVTLSAAKRACVATAGPGASAMPGSSTVILMPIPGSPGGTGGTGGTGGAGAGGGAGGTGGLVSTLSALRLTDVLGGSSLDLSPLLGAVPLPASLVPVPLDALAGPGCQKAGTTCVGIDGATLVGAVTNTLGLNSLLASLLGINTGTLLGQVNAAVAGGDLSGILAITRIDAHTIRLVPRGPLALLASLAVVPSTVVGRVQVTLSAA